MSAWRPLLALTAQRKAERSPPARAEPRQCRALGSAGGSAGPRSGHRPGSAVMNYAGTGTGREGARGC